MDHKWPCICNLLRQELYLICAEKPVCSLQQTITAYLFLQHLPTEQLLIKEFLKCPTLLYTDVV